jgi:hypothetical protein
MTTTMITGTYEWHQADGSYQLSRGGEKIAAMRFRGWGLTDGEADTPSGHFTLVRNGIWKPRYSIHINDSLAPAVTYTPSWGGMEGTAETGGGKKYRWGLARLWSGDHLLADMDGRTILTVARGSREFHWRDLFRLQGIVEIGAAPSDTTTLYLLLILSWWLTLQSEEQAASALVVMS